MFEPWKVWGLILSGLLSRPSAGVPGQSRFTGIPHLQGGHWSGKCQGNLIFLQGQGKVRELVREILNTKKVRERSGNFTNLAQSMCYSRYFDYLKCEESVDFFSRLLKTHENLLILEQSVPRNYLRILFFFIYRIRVVHFSELVKGIRHLLAVIRKIGRKKAVFWSVKNWIWSEKSQWKVREFWFCMRVATLIHYAIFRDAGSILGKCLRHVRTNEPQHDKTNKMTCAPSLIRVLAVRSVGS